MSIDNGTRPNVRPRKPTHRQEQSQRGVIRIAASTTDVIDNPRLVEQWDDEELRRGRRRDKNGKFTGADPLVVPTSVYREIVRRSIRRAETELSVNLEAACGTLTAIATSVAAEDRDRIAAAKIIMERIMGKEPLKVDHTFRTPLYLGIIQGGIVTGGEPVAIGGGDDDDDIVDAQVIEDEVIWE